MLNTPQPSFAMKTKKVNLRREYRQQENERVLGSANLETRFPAMKSLTVHLTHYDHTGTRKSGEIKYTVNLANAKSMFRFNCANHECVGGDFDLSEALAKAVSAHLKTVTGEMRCQGWRSRATMHTMRCEDLLRFELAIGY